MKYPKTCEGWATRVSHFVKGATEALNIPRFPIRIEAVAREYSKNLFPKEPITLVQGDTFDKFEGALVPSPSKNGEWGIFYNKGITSKGRINFTLAHEFGHFLLHRHLSGDPIYCSRSDMWEWDSAYAQMEAEANKFASMVLMPADDFREQTKEFRKPTLLRFEVLRVRYEVSLTAAVLKWLDLTPRRAMLVVSRDGFIDWARSSTALLKSGVFYRARKETIAVPNSSLAALGPSSGIFEVAHAPGIWNDREPVFESVVFDEYRDLTLSLLIYPAEGPNRWTRIDEEPELLDTFGAFERN
jgi:hypothetical protein